MIISTEQAKLDTVLDPSKISFLQGVMLPVTIQSYARDLLEARELIKEMRECLLKISQYPIAYVCEEARIIAREAWKKSKEYAE